MMKFGTVQYNSLLGDFGMARRMSDGVDLWKIDKPCRSSLRCMAIECFTEKIFTELTDVWSFAVALWEIMRYGMAWHDNMKK